MLVVVEKARLRCVLDNALGLLSNQLSGLKELSLLNMASVDLEQLPLVAISLEHPRVLDGWVYIAHMLETPKTCTHCLGYWKAFRGKWTVYRCCLKGEEHWDQRKADSTLVVLWLAWSSKPFRLLQFLSKIIDSFCIPSVPLVEQAINHTMILTDRTRLSSEIERDIERCISSGFNQDELSQRQDMSVLPDLKVLKF